jgi:predicted PurR-regulated permease PerM
VLATFLSAITQAVLAGIGFAVVGIENLWLLSACTLLLSMIPFLGAAAVWIPVCILLVVQDRYLAAGLLAAYCAGIVSTSDNVVKVYIIQGQARLHPLVVFVSIIGALRIYGLWGIFVGPIVAMIFYLLLEIIRDKQVDAPPPVITSG